MTLISPCVSSTPPNILVVEDEFLIRAMLCETLREAGYAVIEANNGDEAAVIMSETSPDLIVTDIRMPGSLDGIALTAKVRETNSTLPIIITSAHLSGVSSQGDNFTTFLSKPYEYTAILKLIGKELENT